MRSLRGFEQLARYVKTNENDTFFAAFLGGRKLVGPHLIEVLYACCEVFLGVLDNAVRYPDYGYARKTINIILALILCV